MSEIAEASPVEPKKPFLVGYARVSMSDQNCQRQIDELVKFGVDPRDVWIDKASGKNMDRPGWHGLWRDLQDGDVVVILSLDRLGRDVLQILQTIEAMKARGVELRVLTGGVDTTTPSGRLAFNIMAAFAQFERELIVERSVHGLAKARERGVIGGRPEKITAAMVEAACARMDKGETKKGIAAEYRVHPNSLGKRMERFRKERRMKGSEK